jgi:hypothetical protein
MAASKTLARQQTLDSSNDQPWSLQRDNQLRSLLEGMFLTLYGPGVVSGCRVTPSTGFSVTIPSGSVFFAHGVVLTLSEDQSYTAAVASTAAVYLWAMVLRTQATQSSPTSSDTYSLSVTHNTTGAAPSDDHCCIAILTTGAAAIESIDNGPAGKFLRQLPNLGQITITVSGTSTLTAAQARNRILVFEGVGSAVTLPNEAGRAWYVVNDTSGDLLLSTSAQALPVVQLAAGTQGLVRCDGENIVDLAPTSADAVTLAAVRTDFDDLEYRFRQQLAWTAQLLGPEFVHPDLLPEIDLTS